MFLNKEFSLINIKATSSCNEESTNAKLINLTANFIKKNPVSTLSVAPDPCFGCSPSTCPTGNFLGPTWTKPIKERLCDCTAEEQNSYATGGSCSDPTFGCYTIDFQYFNCPTPENPDWKCYEFFLTPCGRPEEPNEYCIDEDEDGYYADGIQSGSCNIPTARDCNDDRPDINPGEEENCNTPGDEDCDYKEDCEEEQCRATPNNTCIEFCDQDGDTYFRPECDGADCKDNPDEDANAVNINPEQNIENTEELCTDGKNNDCDSEVDCADSDCASFCSLGDGGGETTTNRFCYNEYLVTDYYYCVEGQCAYQYSTWEYMGSYCYLYM